MHRHAYRGIYAHNIGRREGVCARGRHIEGGAEGQHENTRSYRATKFRGDKTLDIA